MDLILHDLDETDLKSLPLQGNEEVFGPQTRMHHCQGCFACWVKTPGRCKLQDGAYPLPLLLSQAKSMVLVTRIFHGGPSPLVKRLVDRMLPHFHPDFTDRNGEMHHKRRYPNRFDLVVCFYGDADAKAKELANDWSQAMSVNCDSGPATVRFFEDFKNINWEVAA